MNKLTYHMSLTLFTDEKCFGPGPMRLLRGVERTGSLHQSASDMGMAYSKAYRIIKMMEKNLGFQVLISNAGGIHGGGSSITEKGMIFLEKYEEMFNKINSYSENTFKETFDNEFFDKINKI